MSIPAVVDSLESVPESVRELYTEQDGSFVLDVEGADSLPSVKGLKESQRSTLDQRKKAEAALKAFEGLDPEAARAALEKVAGIEAAEIKKAGDWDAQVARSDEKHAKDLAAAESRYQALEKNYRTKFIDADATLELAKQGGDADLLLHKVQAQAKLVNGDGDHRVVIVDADGDARLDSAGKPFTLAWLVAELKEKHPGAFSASGASGDGSGGSNANDAAGVKTVERGPGVFAKYAEGIRDGTVVVAD